MKFVVCFLTFFNFLAFGVLCASVGGSYKQPDDNPVLVSHKRVGTDYEPAFVSDSEKRELRVFEKTESECSETGQSKPGVSEKTVSIAVEKTESECSETLKPEEKGDGKSKIVSNGDVKHRAEEESDEKKVGCFGRCFGKKKNRVKANPKPSTLPPSNLSEEESNPVLKRRNSCDVIDNQ
ncbi:hypothetical protein CWI39_0584p0020 [Hamiltosporidium magnivora]|uniref:Uncharacterized protein n=1 Tax=Hamiltosporidium magnivora TaxID=148818 RepID=A0A4Q9LEF3_9MICR|nr:hypothetical protein CWI39_0584p0020 [Hamiltosporidium magnivora]